MVEKYFIIIMDKYKLIVSGLTEILRNKTNFVITGNCLNLIGLEELVVLSKPDILLINYDAFSNDLCEIKSICQKYYLKYLCFYSYESSDKMFHNCVNAGGMSLISLKTSPEMLLYALETVCNGFYFFNKPIKDEFIFIFKNKQNALTEREKEVLFHYGKGKTRREIACTLYVSVKTIDNLTKSIKNKLNINNIAQLIKVSNDFNFIDIGNYYQNIQ